MRPFPNPHQTVNFLQLRFLKHTRIWLTPTARILFVDEAIKSKMGLIWEDGFSMNVFFQERKFA